MALDVITGCSNLRGLMTWYQTNIVKAMGHRLGPKTSEIQADIKLKHVFHTFHLMRGDDL